MAKISITKNDSVPRIVEKILEREENDIILSVPANIWFEKSLANLELIKREADAAGKNVSIISTDEEIIDFARRAGIPVAGLHTKKTAGQRMMSDIVPVKRDERKSRAVSFPAPAKTAEFRVKENEPPGRAGSFWTKAEEESDSKKKFAGEVSEIDKPVRHERHEIKHRRRLRAPRVIVWTASFVVLLVFAGWAGGIVFGKAEVSLAFKKTNWQYKGTMTASKAFSQIDAAKGYLPAEVFKQQKNTTRLFPASGVAQVSERATAKVVVYNTYSSSRQTLVAATRFMTPGGKIFRLDNQIVVPGAVIKNGKITPSSIEASVTADKAGTDYNVGPFDKLTIPGFKGTSRYDGFYVSMPQAASGGFVGQRKVPTDKDIVSAKDKTNQGLKDAFQSALIGGIPQGFNILDGASVINVTKLVAGKSADDSGNFSVFGEASYQAVGFKNDDLKSLIALLMKKDNPDMDFDGDLKFDYQNIKVDTAAGQLAFAVSVSGTLKPHFSGEDLKPIIAGKSFDEAKTAIMILPHLDNAKISLWPFWISSLPKNTNKIKVVWN